jgi:ribonuclease HII
MSKRVRKPTELLPLCYDEKNRFEISLDEVGRGPLFGRVYTAAVVLPRDGSFNGTDIKDSKKFSSKKKRKEVAEYIRENALAYHIHYIEPDVIDEINILQAVFRCMHECIKQILLKLENLVEDPFKDVLIVVDGDRFKPYCMFDVESESLKEVPHITIEQGDAKYMAIAAASIIAKVAHDEYIEEMCKIYPALVERYQLDKNVGYGTKHHIDGIRNYGITEWHRKSYGLCRDALYSPITNKSNDCHT